METEMLKLIGGGGSQIILAAGYIPMFWLIKILWSDRADALAKLVEMLRLQFADQDGRKELWRTQGGIIEGQTRTISDLKTEVAGLRDELRRGKP
jgi:hypothetical protein